MKVAMIGTGTICEQHLLGLAGVPEARLVGVCDLSPAMGRYTAERFKADRYYTDHRAMLDEAKPDVVHVLTPPGSHKRLVADCVEAGAHVFCEKPVALAHGDFRAMWDHARSKDLRLVEDQNYRFNRPIRAIRGLVDAGALGEVREVEVRMALKIREEGSRYGDPNLRHPSHDLPAGVLHEFVTHLAYLMLHFAPHTDGVAFDRVVAAWSNHGGGELFKYDDLDATVILGGVHGRLRFSANTAPEGFNVTVRGTEGYATCDLFQPHVLAFVPRRGGKQLSPIANLWLNGRELCRASVRNLRDKVMQRTPYEGLHELVRQTYAALRDGRPMPVTFADMDDASRLVDALLAEENRA